MTKQAQVYKKNNRIINGKFNIAFKFGERVMYEYIRDFSVYSILNKAYIYIYLLQHAKHDS